MKCLTLVACISLCMPLSLQPALGGTWYVPMKEQVLGGFDHIQIRMCYPYQFDSPAMSAFCGPSPVGEQWSQTFLNQTGVFATADGPDPGDEAIHFSIWIAGDRETDRPAFQFQAYSGETRVDNADIICFGSGEMDWMVAPGTWTQNSPIPPWIPGDANLTADVDLLDLTIVANNWSQGGRSWEEGDFNGDGWVDLMDLTLLANNWLVGGCAGPGPAEAQFADPAGLVIGGRQHEGGAGPAVPEPGTIALLALGGSAVLFGRRRAR